MYAKFFVSYFFCHLFFYNFKNLVWNNFNRNLLQFSSRIQAQNWRLNKLHSSQPFSIWKTFYKPFNSIQLTKNNISTPSIPHATSLLYSPLLNTTQIRQRVSTVYQKKMKAFKAPKKLKTKSSIKKRFRLSNTGTLKRRSTNKQHHAWAKNRAKINQLGQWRTVEGKMKKNMLRLMGHCKTYK